MCLVKVRLSDEEPRGRNSQPIAASDVTSDLDSVQSITSTNRGWFVADPIYYDWEEKFDEEIKNPPTLLSKRNES